MPQFAGTEPFSHPPDAVLAAVGDAGWLAAALPNTTVLQADRDAATWRATPNLPFLSGGVDGTLAVLTRVEGRVSLRKTADTSAGSAVVLLDLAVSPSGSGSVLRWQAEVTELTRLLKLTPAALVRSAGEKAARDVWAAVRRKLGEK